MFRQFSNSSCRIKILIGLEIIFYPNILFNHHRLKKPFTILRLLTWSRSYIIIYQMQEWMINLCPRRRINNNIKDFLGYIWTVDKKRDIICVGAWIHITYRTLSIDRYLISPFKSRISANRRGLGIKLVFLTPAEVYIFNAKSSLKVPSVSFSRGQQVRINYLTSFYD